MTFMKSGDIYYLAEAKRSDHEGSVEFKEIGEEVSDDSKCVKQETTKYLIEV